MAEQPQFFPDNERPLESGKLIGEEKQFTRPVLLRIGEENIVIVAPGTQSADEEITATFIDQARGLLNKLILRQDDFLNEIRFGRKPVDDASGTSKSIHLVDSSGKTSRQHGSIQRQEDGSFSVADMSSNGTAYAELAIPVQDGEGESIHKSKEFYVASDNPVHVRIGTDSSHVVVVPLPTAEHPGNVSVVWDNENKKHQLDFPDGKFSLKIGRSTDGSNDIVLGDSGVSRHHGALEYNNGYLKVIDSDSKYGTSVRAVEIAAKGSVDDATEELLRDDYDEKESERLSSVVDVLESNIRPENMEVGETKNGAGFAFLTFEGRRQYQEDRIVIHQSADKKKTSVCVADGMGGHGHGDVAAQTFSASIQESYRSKTPLKGEERLELAQQALARNTEIPTGSGLVYVEMLFDSDSPNIEVIHQGDSRAMQFTSNGEEVRRTKDHNFGGSRVYRAVVQGNPQEYSPESDHDMFTRKSKNVYIAASDGVWDNISQERVAYLIRVSDHIADPVQRAQQIAREMTNNVLDSMDGVVPGGNKDNITLYVHVEP